MSNSKLTKFIFDNVDLQNGSVTVRFINPYGVIETGEKSINDFKQIIQVPTGSFKQNGTPITRPQEIILNDNPNEDIIFAYDIPLNDQDEFITNQELIDYIARQYPDSVFDKMYKRKIANPRPDLEQLKNKRFEIEIIYEQPQLQSAPNFDMPIIEEIIV